MRAAPVFRARLTLQFSCRIIGKKWQLGRRAMQDYQAQLEKLRTDAAECALIRDLATDKAKRELFDRLANHLTVLAEHIELAMLKRRKSAGP